MKSEFVTYNIAKKLKELGFNKPCFAKYNHYEGLFINQDEILTDNKYTDDSCNAPLWQQCINWLRDVKKIHVSASPTPVINGQHGYQVQRIAGGVRTSNGWTPAYEKGDTYYTALEAAIKEALELIKK